MKICIFSPHEDKYDFTNRNLNYSKFLSANKVDCTLYVSNFNYRSKKQKKLKNKFYEIDYHNKVRIVRLYTTKFFNNDITRVISYIIFFLNSLFFFFFWDKKKYNFIIGESAPPLIGLSALICCLKGKSKFIYQIRDPWPICLYYSNLLSQKSLTYVILEFINKLLIKNSRFIISTLPNLKSYYRSKYKYDKEIYHLPNGCDVLKINNLIKNKKIKFENNSSRLIYAGGFSPSHQVLNYFKAIKYIQDNHNNLNISYTFIGNGIDLNQCQNFVKKNNLKKIKFLKSIKKSKVYELLLKNNLGVCTITQDKNEIFGYNLNKLYDYIACGLPIIFTNNYYKNRFIEKNHFGFNCSINYIDIAKKIIKYHKLSTQNKKILSVNAKKFCKLNYNVNYLAKKLLKILLEEK